MGRIAIDMVGKRFGRLVVVERAGSDKYSKPIWKCLCDCGNETIINGAVLRRGDSISCGCMQGIRKDLEYKPLIMRKSHNNRLYNTWSGILYRCCNKNASSYEYYGARGILVCNEWQESFEVFAKWAINSGYANDLEIDRIDNDGNYEPNNCRWINHSKNSKNRGIKKTNLSGATGVQKRGKKWRASITCNYETIRLGTFETFEDALQARKDAELKYWG